MKNEAQFNQLKEQVRRQQINIDKLINNVNILKHLVFDDKQTKTIVTNWSKTIVKPGERIVDFADAPHHVDLPAKVLKYLNLDSQKTEDTCLVCQDKIEFGATIGHTTCCKKICHIHCMETDGYSYGKGYMCPTRCQRKRDE